MADLVRGEFAGTSFEAALAVAAASRDAKEARTAAPSLDRTVFAARSYLLALVLERALAVEAAPHDLPSIQAS